MGRLTKRAVEAAQPQGSDYFIWDGDLAGFGLRVMPSGRRSYLVQYRAGGRTRRVGLGVHGAVTPDQARKRARDLLGAVARGEDPAEEIRTHRRAPTVAALCDRFLAEHVAHRCKPTTRGEYRRSVDLFIKPRIGNLKLPDVRRADIARLHHELRHIPYQANRTLGVLSKMFNLAELWGLMADGANPCRHVKKYPERRRERFLSPEEYRRLWWVLAELEGERPAMRPALNAIRLLTLTGCRLSEIQTLRWEHVREAALELSDGKTGARRVPLCPEAIAVLGAIERLPDNPYVITGTKPGQHLTDLERPWRRIRARAGLDKVPIHDLRHSFASAEDYRRLWSVLAELEGERPAMRPALNAIRLLVLTGCRPSEIQTLRWEQVRGAALELPDGKTGARRVPLCPEAIAVLGSIERLADNPYVITATKPGQHLTDLERPWRRIRALAGLDEVRIHDLRHSFASAAVANGESLPMIGKLLGHKQVQTTARYAHLADDPVHAAAARVGGVIAAAVGAGRSGDAPAR